MVSLPAPRSVLDRANPALAADADDSEAEAEAEAAKVRAEIRLAVSNRAQG